MYLIVIGTNMWQSEVEIDHYSIAFFTALPCSKCCNTELPLRVGLSLVPRLSWNVNMYRAESLVSFVHKHDVIGPKQKGNVLHVVQLTMLQRSVCTCMLFNAR